MVARALRFSAGAAFIVLSACGGSDNTSGGTTNTGPTGTTPVTTTPVVTTSVTLQNSSFTPAAIRVSPGAVVSFTNSDGIAHNVTFTSSAITGSGDFTSGTKSITMPTTVGSYPYRCTIHAGMTGNVDVQ